METKTGYLFRQNSVRFFGEKSSLPGKTRTGCKGVLWLKGELIAIQGGDYLQYLATCARVTSAALAMFSSFDSL